VSTRRKLAAVEDPVPPVRLRASVDAAIAGMTWLTPSDLALADLARTIADQIDGAQERADLLQMAYADAGRDEGMYKRLQRLEALCDVQRVVAANSQPLLLALRDLGGTPAARKVLDAAGKTGGKLAGLRADAAAAPAKRAASGPRKRAAAAVDPAAEEADPPDDGRVRRNRVR